MAYIWYMIVQAESNVAANAFATSFDRSTVEINGHSIWFSVYVEHVDALWWGVFIIPTFAPEPDGEFVASGGGPESSEHAQLLTEIGHVLYERLLKSSPFHIALAGVECEGFYGFDHDDLIQYLTSRTDGLDGLVISAALWRATGSPKAFVPRSDGTYWIPWLGESF